MTEEHEKHNEETHYDTTDHTEIMRSHAERQVTVNFKREYGSGQETPVVGSGKRTGTRESPLRKKQTGKKQKGQEIRAGGTHSRNSDASQARYRHNRMATV